MTGPTATAALAASVLGPLTLLLARQRMHTPWAPRSVETAAIVTAAGIAATLALHAAPTSLVVLPLAALGPAAAVVDAYEGRLPDLLTLPVLAATLLTAAVAGGSGGRGLAVAALATAAAVLVKIAATDAVGWGDVKLIPTLAVVLADGDLLVQGVVVTAGLVAVTALVVGVRHRDAAVPYGPALIVGTLGVAAGL